MTVRRPTFSQLKSIVTGFGMNMSDQRIGEFLSLMDETIKAYDAVDAMPDYLPSVDYPRTAGYRPSAEENPLNAWYVKTEIRGAPRGPLGGQEGGDQGQCVRCRRADDERLIDAQRLYPRRRCHHRHPPARCRRHHRRQVPLRGLLSLRRQPYQCDGAGAQPPQARVFGRRLVLGLGRAGGLGRDRNGHRRRPGRFHPHAVLVLRLLRHEADPRPRALYRRHADRGHHRPHRSDHRHRLRQCPDAGGGGGRGRARSAPVQCRDRQVHRRAGARGEWLAHRRGERGLWPFQLRGRRGRQGARRGRSLQETGRNGR